MSDTKNAFISVVKLIEKNAADYPDKSAVESTAKSLTYGAFNKEANRTAHKLIADGVKADDIVMILLPRCVEVYVAGIGTLKAGGAYTVANVIYPDDRIEYIVGDGSIKRIITNREVYQSRKEFLDRLGVHTFIIEDMIADGQSDNPCINIKKEDLCYCIYTSGSTGKPKGVMIEHGNLANYVECGENSPEMNAIRDRVNVMIAVSQFTFDASIMDQYPALCYGKTVAIVTEEETLNASLMRDFLEKHKVDGIIQTPSYVSTLVSMSEVREQLKRVKYFVAGGENYPKDLYLKLRELCPDATIINAYGPTEATVNCTVKVLTDPDDITIGKPNDNVFAYIIDDNNQEVAKGEIGELLICGAGVGRGYINLPEKTAAAFITFNGMRGYKTGDLARILDNGEIECHGRKDNQVKIRGLRVELGEIESVMEEFEGLTRAICRVRTVRGAEHLCTWYTAEKQIDEAMLISHMKSKLTHYMIPDYLMKVDSFELTVNGKVNDKVLPEIELGELDVVEARNDAEQKILAECRRIAGFDSFGVTDALSVLGFTSLSMVALASFILDTFDVEMKLTDLLRSDCSVSSISEIIEAERQKGDSQSGKASGQALAAKVYDYAGRVLLAPQQKSLTLTNALHQMVRRITFNTSIDPEKLRDAVVKTISGANVFKLKLVYEDGEYYQYYEERKFLASDIKVLDRDFTQEDFDTFARPIDVLKDNLFEFVISAGEKTELLFKIHHILLDHEGMKTFLDRIMMFVHNPEASIAEKADYLDYVTDLHKRKEEMVCADQKKYEAMELPNSDKEVPLPSETKYAMGAFSVPEEIAKADIGNYCLGRLVNALCSLKGSGSVVVNYTFGGRNQAKYFDTLGYFPYMIPVKIQKDASVKEIGAAVLDAIENYSPWRDCFYNRIYKNDSSLNIMFNYLEAFDSASEGEYAISPVEVKEVKESPEVIRMRAQVDYACMSRGGRVGVMLNYDPSYLSEEEAQKLLAEPS